MGENLLNSPLHHKKPQQEIRARVHFHPETRMALNTGIAIEIINNDLVYGCFLQDHPHSTLFL